MHGATFAWLKFCGTGGKHGNKRRKQTSTNNLCSAGTPTSVNGSGSWTWSLGLNGGTTANCTANILILKGDINGDGTVNLADAILALQVMSEMNPAGIRTDYVTSGSDVNNDGNIGLPEAIYILQKVAGMR